MAQSLRGYAHLPQWLYAAGINRFNDIFTSFYAHQRYDVINEVTRA